MIFNAPKTYFNTLLLCICCVSLQATASEGFGVYIDIDSITYSEPMAIKGVINDWDGEFVSGSKAFTFDKAEVGVKWKEWQLGLFQRYEYVYGFSPDTAYLKYRSENKIDLIPGEKLDLYLSANSFIAKGISIGYSQSIENVNYTVSVAYLKAKELLSGSVDGEAEVLAENDYSLIFDVDYYYYEDKLFDRVVKAPEGKGYSVDIAIDWKINNNWNVQLEAHDLLGRIYWKNAPRTIATADNNTRSFDENGYVVFAPVASGVELTESFSQKLNRKIDLQTDYMFSNYSVFAVLQDYDVERFYLVGTAFQSGTVTSKIYYNITASAIGFGFEGNGFGFELVSDNTDLDKALLFGLNIYYAYMF